MATVVRADFFENNKYYPQAFLDECLYKISKMETEDKLKEIDIKNLQCYYFDDIIKDVDIYFSDILLDKKNYMKIFHFMTFYTTLERVQNHRGLGSIK